MKTHSHLTIRQLLFAVLFLLAFILLTVFLFTFRRDQQLFEHISAELFREDMASNTLNMHYTLAYPEDFGIYDYDAVLPCYSAEDRLKGQAETENTLALLHSLNPSRLSESDRYTCSLLIRSLTNTLEMSGYTYYEEPLSPSSGMQSQLPILLAEYTFRTRQDVEDYLSLLDQTDHYFASLLTFEQEKAAAGLLMPAASLEKVRQQCDTILTADSLEAGAHFLQTTFLERLQELYARGGITREDAALCIAQNNRLLKTVMLPAYEALSDGLFVLEDETISPGGLASKPDGAAYYQKLLISETGSYRSIEEIKELLSRKFNEEYQAIRQIIAAHPELGDLAYDEELEFSFPYQNPTQMLSDLQMRMQKDFPSLDIASGENPSASAAGSHSISAAVPAGPSDSAGVPASDYSRAASANTSRSGFAVSADTGGDTGLPACAGSNTEALLPVSTDAGPAAPVSAGQTSLPSVTVKTVSESLEDYCAPAFYLTPPLDDTSSNVIYINEKSTPAGLELYTTLAHEGYPGHMYQSVFNNRTRMAQGDKNVRQLLWYGGYLEGWALYVEFISFDYASDLLTEQGRQDLAEAVALEKHNRSLQLCLYSLLDIMIHYDNASFEQVKKVLNAFGIKQDASVSAVYSYIAEEPANYLKYYLGCMEILELKEQARLFWGESYSDFAFHTFYLTSGPSDFTTLGEYLAHYDPPAQSPRLMAD